MSNGRNTSQRDKDRARLKATRANCYLCGDALDYNLKWPDPMCFVADHVIPLIKGGADNITNKRAAHSSCNSKKRARLIAPIVRRSRSLE